MNQILMTEQPSRNNKNNRNKMQKEKRVKQKRVRDGNGEIETISIVKFFCVTIIIFGLCLSGSGVYGVYQDIERINSAIEPVVTADRRGKVIKLTVSSEVGVKAVKYAWNDNAETVVQGNNKKTVETDINVISGENNKLNLTVIDSKNNTKQYIKNYMQETIDTIEPVISIVNDDPGIKITVTDDTALDYIVYKYGDEPEVRVKATDSDPTKIEASIDQVQEAEVLLTVEAVDKAQNVATKEQKTKGATKPKIAFSAAEGGLAGVAVDVTDNDGLMMVVFYVNEEEVYKTEIEYDSKQKELNAIAPLDIFPVGESTLRVVAYNLSEQVAEESIPIVRNN